MVCLTTKLLRWLRHFETGHKYVDRVRFKNTSSDVHSAHRGSGWRQRSISHIDLSKSSRNCQFRYPRTNNITDYNNNNNNNHDFNDFYSLIEPEKDYEEPRYVNIDDRQKSEPTEQRFETGNDFCSLRRTRSLAAIREETFSDLQITGNCTRRSQLIPRAKLVHRKLFREKSNRHQERRREENRTGSGVETQTSDTRESGDYYSNLKRLDSIKIFPSQWQNDRSDLESLNSEYFRNSAHQKSPRDRPKKHGKGDKQGGSHKGKNSFQVLEIEVHHDNSQSSAFPETTTSNSDHSDTASGPECEADTNKVEEGDQSNQTLTSTPNEEIDSEVAQSLLHEKKGHTNCEPYAVVVLKEEPKQDTPTFIAYDSVYLSSEESSEETIVQGLNKESVAEKTDELLVEISIDEEVSTPTSTDPKSSVEKLYTKINKPPSTKPKILAAENKVHRTSLIEDFLNNQSRRSNLERLSYISASQILKARNVDYPTISWSNIGDNQYYSLPDINISRSLKVSESIDDKLRSSYDQTDRPENGHFQEDIAEKTSVDYENLKSIDNIYDSIARFGRANKRARQREYLELNSIADDTTPTANSLENDRESSIVDTESEKPKEENTIEVSPTLCSDEFKTEDPSGDSQDAEELSSFTSGQFKIIVTDTNDNIIKEESFDNLTLPFNESLSDIEDIYSVSNSLFKAEPAQIYADAHVISEDNQPKMSRPQILHVVDSKRSKSNSDAKTERIEKEFSEKVDSVRCYWSKLIQVEKNARDSQEVQKDILERNFVTSIEEEHDEVDSSPGASVRSAPHRIINESSNYESYCPTVEIVELDGDKKAAIIKAHNLETAEFDHVRYKVMKSDLFQKNIVTRTKKEAQFDGLMQYLQDYSFQELLTNNNVVIIEPVRTKIEKPSESRAKLDPINCRVTGRSSTEAKSTSSTNSASTKRHFFYHPVRVNREMLEEELPNPDTVRNARKFFEENAGRRQPNFNKPKSSKSNDYGGSSTSSGSSITNNNGIKRRSLRYLTVDTSYGNPYRKWDSGSLSSGISSGDLSSPCGECNDNEGEIHRPNKLANTDKPNFDDSREEHEDQSREIYSSNENLCDDICESYYVSEDVLEKIRECGSSVTYYGGRVVDNRSPQLSPMTKAIMDEIRGKGVKCHSCQPNNCPPDLELKHKTAEANNFGMKFKLVKSNSCSSRLELVGTGKFSGDDKLRHDEGSFHSFTKSERSDQLELPKKESEESVRDLVNRLENGSINATSVPRIIESKCIEKTSRPGSETQSPPDESVTINNHLIASSGERMSPVDIIKQVTVNNHISIFSPFKTLHTEASNSPQTQNPDKCPSTPTNGNWSCKKTDTKEVVPNKLCRNKNVDLAFNLSKNGCLKSNIKDGTEIRRASISSISSSSSDNAINEEPCNRIRQAIKEYESTSLVSGPTAVVPSSGNERNKVCKADTTRVVTVEPTNIVSEHTSKAELPTTSTTENNTEKQHVCSHESMDPNPGPQASAAQRHEHKIIESDHPETMCKSSTNIVSAAIHKFDMEKSFERHYVANDQRLIARRPYDEIEFESFEVYDPDTAEATVAAVATNNKLKATTPAENSTEPCDPRASPSNGECFDSLDEKL